MVVEKCTNCGTPLLKKDIINTEKEYSYVCRGEAYDELEDVPSQRRGEAEYCETIIVTYECSNDCCGVEITIEK